MKRTALTAIALCVIASFAFAAEHPSSGEHAAEHPVSGGQAAEHPVSGAQTVTLTGTIIDNLCAAGHKEDLADFIKTHPKTCALMPDCAASGYSIYTEGSLIKFDKDSSAKIEEFLKKEDSKLDVVVTATKSGEELTLSSIENQR